MKTNWQPKVLLKLLGWLTISGLLLNSGLSAHATTLQELFGFNTRGTVQRSPRMQWVSTRLQPQSHAQIQSQTQIRQLTPITRRGLRYANALGERIDADGYYVKPFTPEEFWGVSLADGTYSAVMFWEGQQVSPTTRRLADGTVYFDLPPNTVRVRTSNGIQFWDVSNANSMLFEVQGGLVRRQRYSFEGGAY